MFARSQATQAKNRRRHQVEAARRESDPLEVAKTTLRRQGYVVVSHGDMILVDRKELTRKEVIAKAAGLEARRKGAT